jgi:hypothetical protein
VRRAAGVVLGLLLGVPAAGAAQPSADVVFPSPVPHAIVVRATDNAELLVARGDSLFHPAHPSRSATVAEVLGDALVVRTESGVRRRVAERTPVPGLPGLVFVRAVPIVHLRYRYRAVDVVSRVEPALIELRGVSATLEIETPRLPPRGPVGDGAGGLGVLAGLRLQEREPGRYDVERGAVQALLESAGRLLLDLRPFVVPAFSMGSGFEYRVTSAASDGVLGADGFTVYDPKLAARAGIRIGDRLVRVNGRPVDGLASLYRLYQELHRNPDVASIEVELERAGRRLTQSYHPR